jgi:hypothetical protein
MNSKPAHPEEVLALPALILVTVCGAWLRLAPALASSFPIGDGGLFYAMAHDLQVSHFALPLYTSYNGGGIPFLYPPLGMYMAAGLSSLFHLSLLDLVRLLPPLVSVLCIPAIYSLALIILENKGLALLAAMVFTALPTSFDWLSMGGGLTRAPGFLFAILALRQAWLLYHRNRRSDLAWTAVLASLAVYSHPAMAWFLCFSVLLFFLFSRPTWSKVGRSLLVGASVMLLTAPWWLTAAVRFGPAFLWNGLVYGSGTISAWTFIPSLLFAFTDEPLLDILAVLGLLGVLVALRERSYWLPAWFFLVFVFQTRFSAVVATAPFALLAALGIGRLVLPGLARKPEEGETRPVPLLNWVQILFLVYFFGVGLFSANAISVKDAVTPDHLAAMSWVEQSTSPGSTFIIVAGGGNVPGSYPVPEWFPVFAQRTSLSTNQGQEWLQDNSQKLAPANYDFLQTCALQDLSCLDEWDRRTGLTWDYVYLLRPAVTLADGSPSRLWQSLQSSPSYTLVFQNASALIYYRNPQ